MINDQASELVYNIKEGHNIAIECVATGQPAPMYSWKKEGSSVISLKNRQRKYIFHFDFKKA